MIIKKRKEALAYTILFVILTTLMAAFFAFRGKSFIHTGDPFDQDYPIFLYLGRCLQGFINGEGIHLYDFSIGLGENVIAPLNLYGFGDPLNLLSVFVSSRNGEFLYTQVLFLRMYLTGMGMLAFLKSHDHCGMLAVGGALLYAFSLFSIIRGFHFYSLLNVMYLFPFLLIQLERLTRGKKQYVAAAIFALLIAVQACCSFYFLYMQTIFLVTYALLFYWEIYGGNIEWHHLLGKISETTLFYLLGVLTSGAILFPTLREFFYCSRMTGGLAQKKRLIFSLKELVISFSNLLVPMTNDDNYGLAIPCLSLMAVIIYLINSKYLLKGKLVVYALMIAYICPFFWSMTNGFSYESDRWTYILYFGLAYITVVILEEYIKGNLPRKYIIIAAFPAVLSIGVHMFLNMDKIRSAAYLMVILVCVFSLIKFKLNEKQLLAILFGCVALNLFFLIAPWQVCGHDLWKSYCSKSDIAYLSTEVEKEDEEADFGRIDVKPVSRADSLVADYMGTTEYFSILNGNTYHFWEQLLISPGICAQPHHIEGLDGRAPLEALLSVTEYQDGNQIVENKYVLPLGVQYTEAISYDQFSGMSPLQKQHILMEKIVLEEGAEDETKEDFEPITLNYEAQWKNFSQEEDFFVPHNNANITLKIDNEEIKGRNGELYVYFSGFQCFKDDFAAVDIEEHELLVQNAESKYYTGLKDYLVHVTPKEEGKIVISFPEGNQYVLKDIAVLWYDYEGMREAVEILRENSLQNVKFTNDRISGDIEAQNGWLFLNIPYSSDWKASVDGQKVEISRANVGFMAVYLEKGSHFVEFEYKPIWFRIGMFCTIFGLLIIAGLIISQKSALKGKIICKKFADLLRTQSR